MKKHFLPLILGLAGVFAIATAFGTGDEPLDEPEDDGVVLGEEDLAERGEILRNQFRRMTPGDEPLVQDVGTWPAAWEEFGPNWDGAAVEREYGAWVVPVEVEQTNGATVIRDGTGLELWRGTTDFARPESSDVVLTGGLVAEEDWAVYEAVRGAVEEMTAEASRVDEPRDAPPESETGLRFTAHEWTASNTFRVEMAYEVDTNVDVFAYAVLHASNQVNSTWTNDENMVVHQSYTVWVQSGAPFNGRDSDWTYLDTVSISNGVAEYEDSGFPDELGRLRFYALALSQDSDGDGLRDGQEAFITHTDHLNSDSDGDGIDDGVDTFPSTSNVWFMTTTTNGLYYQRLLPDCGLNAPEVTIEDWSWTVTGQAPTADSVVLDVCVNGYVDDYIKVDTHEVDPGQGPHTYINRHVTNEIANLQSRQFSIQLVDWPDPTYSGANEVRLGTSQSEPFEVEWTWLVPMSLTGPEHVCVGNTAQFVATGAGGGPYTWSVDTDSTTPAAEIDPDSGLLTGLAPGIAMVIATVGDVYAVSQAVNVVQIDFLIGDGNTPASSLKIGKWENAFATAGTNVTVKDNFIDLDPDRFKVRVIDMSKAGNGYADIALSTLSAYPVSNDDATGIMLYEEPYGSGIFLSTNQLLVADGVDDDFSNALCPSDDSPNDRTHTIGLGGRVHVRYPRWGDTWTEKEIFVDKNKMVHVIPIILRDKPLANDGTPVISESAVHHQLENAQKRLAQLGIELTWADPEVFDPPEGVDLWDGLTLRTATNSRVLAVEAKFAISGIGLFDETNHIHLIYVNNLVINDGEPPEASSVSQYWYYPSSEAPYRNNIFMSGPDVLALERAGYVIGHELGHILTNHGHADEVWRLMFPRVKINGVIGSRRFVAEEEIQIQGSPHVQEQ